MIQPEIDCGSIRMTDAIRWRQRFENFERAFRLLQEAFEKDPSQMSDLEKEGVVQRFEYTFELAWKTLYERQTDP